jgi:membrane associated rhomboid family serine protease
MKGYGARRLFFKGAPVVKSLIIATLALFALQLFLPRFGVDFGRYLALTPERAIEGLWVWQFVTYIFLHSLRNLFHIIFNMLFLWWFGRELEQIYGSKKFLLLYLGGGIFAGLFYCFFKYSMAMNVRVIGASGAVYAVLLIYAIFFPNRRILFFFVYPMKIWVFVLIAIGIDLAYSISGDINGIANTAHLGGALFGFLFYRFEKRVEQHFESMGERLERRRVHKDIQSREDMEKRLDAILEKISREGMHKLSNKEKEFLKQASEHYRKKSARS